MTPGSLPTPQPKNSAEEADLRQITPRKWSWRVTNDRRWAVIIDDEGEFVAQLKDDDDAADIVAALAVLPSLLAEVDRLRAENERLREALNLLREGHYDVGDVVLDGLRAEAERDAAVARAEAASYSLDRLRERAVEEIADAKAAETYAGEVDNGLALASAEARRWAWETALRAIDAQAAALASATPPVAEQPRECEHTEHAIRGTGRVGRRFPKDGPDVGIWEPCPAALASAVLPTKQDQQREQWGHRCGECRSADGCDAAAQCLAASPVQQEDKQQ